MTKKMYPKLAALPLFAVLLFNGPTSTQGVLQKSPDCGKSLGCVINSKATILLTWKATKIDVTFGLKAELGPGDAYVAMGISDDNKMGDDEVIECLKTRGIVKVSSSYNTGKNNARFTDLVLKNATGQYKLGAVECSFKRALLVPSSDIRYDLDTRWYVLLVTGRLMAGTEIKLKHHEQSATKSPLSLVDPGSFQTEERSYQLIHVHACLMILAWVTMASIGVTVARHYKGLLPDTELFGKRIWFQIHQSLMVLVVVLTSIGFIVIFCHVGGYMKAEDGISRAHPVLGIIVMALTLINPIMAVFRPLPNSHRRPIFNWAHRSVGMVAKILAVVTIFLGLKLEEAEAPVSTLYVLGAFVFWHIAVNAVQFGIAFKRQRDQTSLRSKSNSARSFTLTGKRGSTDDSSQPKVSAFQEILLILHSVVAIAVCITLFSLLLAKRKDE